MPWNEFNICKCIQSMLIECGFQDVLILRAINNEYIERMETYLNENRDFLNSLPDCHKITYQSQIRFNFLPVHRLSIENLPQNLANRVSDAFSINNSAFSPLLKEIIQSALSNANKTPQAHRYSKVLTSRLFDVCLYDWWACNV